MRVIDNDREILARIHRFRASGYRRYAIQGLLYRFEWDTECASEVRRSESVLEREFSGKMHVDLFTLKRKVSAVLVGVIWAHGSERERSGVLDREHEVAASFAVIRVRDDSTRPLLGTGEFPAYLEFRIRVCLKRAVRFDMLRREVREDEPVKINEAMPELPGAFGGHFEHRRRAVFFKRIVKKSLGEKSARHGHASQVSF